MSYTGPYETLSSPETSSAPWWKRTGVVVAAVVLVGLTVIGVIVAFAVSSGRVTVAQESGESSPVDYGPGLPSELDQTPVEPEPEPEGPLLNERGNIEKVLGEEGGIANFEGTPLVTFAVDAIKPVECTEEYYDYEPENGRIIAVDMRVATAPELGSEYFSVSGFEFSYIGENGVTVSNLSTIATYSCLPEKELLISGQMTPGSQYVGKVLLDVPAETGTLVYRPMSVADNGWEWKF